MIGFPKPIKAPKEARKRIRRVSKKMRERLQQYAMERLYILQRDGGCVVCRYAFSVKIPCDGRGPLEVDHIDGRFGDLLIERTNMVALHRAAHRYKTDHARECRPALREYARRAERA